MPFLIDESFCVRTEVSGLNKAVQNFRKLGLKLAANFSFNSDILPIEGIVGTDIIQFLRELKTVKCMSGVAFDVKTGLIPYGHINHFLYRDQIGNVVNSSHENNFNTIVSSVKCPTNLVDIAVTPRETYEDPFLMTVGWKGE